MKKFFTLSHEKLSELRLLDENKEHIENKINSYDEAKKLISSAKYFLSINKNVLQLSHLNNDNLILLEIVDIEHRPFKSELEPSRRGSCS